MQAIWNSREEKLHTRNIEVTTYDYDGRRIIVKGLLKDDHFHEYHSITGETFPRGVFHHMAIRLLVNCSNLLIEDVDVDLISVRREVCREAIHCLAPIKGLTITRGFMSKVRKLVGGNKGCTHLVELLQAMAPAIFQGAAAHRSQKSYAFDADESKKIFQSITNTCRGWHEDDPFVEMFKKKLDMK